ncbi:MAG: hypothetical protein LC746_00690, partial [Acidobacteria bacterium]|nr:hypothetical protein [Acidobacteriota bacterium]
LMVFAAALAGVVLLTLVSGGFADGVSRVAEAVFEAVEYRLAVVSARRAASRARARGSAGEVGGAQQVVEA